MQEDSNSKMARQIDDLNEANEILTNKTAETKKELEEVRKDLCNVQGELESFKTFQSMYKQYGGETHFYIELEHCYNLMENEFKDDPEKLKQLEAWYRNKRKMKITKVSIAMISGGIVGGMVGGLLLHATIVAASCALILSPAGVILFGVGVGVIMVGASLAAYKAYRLRKIKRQDAKNPEIIKNIFLESIN
ncbi:uncharacterized protein LOC120343234 [Styela clava]